MDTSLVYADMCVKAIEIQDVKGIGYDADFENGDFVTLGMTTGAWSDFECSDRSTARWIPRQDQLQEMYCAHAFGKENVINWAHSILDRFQYMVLSDDDFVDNTYKMRSLEQLWLAFVMKEKYSKRWSSSEQKWVKVSHDNK